MQAGIRISSLIRSGLVIESVSDSSDAIIFAVRSEAGMAACSLCGASSRRIHSRYDRRVADLPCAGKQICLRVITRRFVCEASHCRRRIFAERFGEDVLSTRSRRTARIVALLPDREIATVQAWLSQQLHKVPSARVISRLMTTSRDHLSKADTVTIAAIEARVPALAEACRLVEWFQSMLRQKRAADLDPWIVTASASLIASLASGIVKN